MGSVWLTIPSARPPAECEPILRLWRTQGYKIALFREVGMPAINPSLFDFCEVSGSYPGYASACNYLIRYLIATRQDAEWFICAGDDTEPEITHPADVIAAVTRQHFYRTNSLMDGNSIRLSLFGVMQPTGDRWHEGVGGFENAPIDRVAGSAWYGREYCRRMYQGNGPLFEGYKHMFVDEEAQEVAIKMGVFWQRRDLTQKHCHWGRGETDKSVIELKPDTIPPHLVKWNTTEHWNSSKQLFEMRKAAGFPGHEPIA